MILRCPLTEYCQINALWCLLKCPVKTKAKCSVYDKNYEALQEMDIEMKYIERYGEPVLPYPRAREIAAKRAEKAAKRKAKEEAKKGKRKRRTKKEIEESKVVVVTEAKPKRKRRTKAEMEDARSKGGK